MVPRGGYGVSGKIALVIGNGAYAHASRLENPANDARAIAATLTRIGFSGVSHGDMALAQTDANKDIVPLLDLDYAGLRRALAAFARAADDVDQAVLYYAGHGIEVLGQNYLIPVDARLEHVKDVEFETASLMQVLNAVGGEGLSGLRLIILDACRDNPFRSRLFATRDFTRGLRAIEPGRNILVAYAAKHGTVALDGTSGNSPYAKALIQHLEQPGLEIMDMFREIKDAVLETTGQRQEPYLYGSLGRRREYFVPPPAVQPEPPPKPLVVDPGTVEHTYWMEVKDSADPEDFEQFIAGFPDGKYLPLARRKIERWIEACPDQDLLRRFVASHPDSPRAALARARIAQIEVKQAEGREPTNNANDDGEDQLPPPPSRVAAEQILKELEAQLQTEPIPPVAQEILKALEEELTAPSSRFDPQDLVKALEQELESRPSVSETQNLLGRLEEQLKPEDPPSVELSLISRMILDLLLLFYSPSWKWVMLIGACSIVLSVLTWLASQAGEARQLLVGFIFALALALCLWLSGAKDLRRLLIIVAGAFVMWPVAALTAGFLAGYLDRPSLPNIGFFFGGMAGGIIGAIAVSALVQLAFGGGIRIRLVIKIGALGACAGSLLLTDVMSMSMKNPDIYKLEPWFSFAAWQLMMLMTTSSIVSRRMRSDEWRRADWPVANR